MKKLISILLFTPIYTLSGMDGDGRESELKRLKSCKKLEFQLTRTEYERGEAEPKKLKSSLSDPQELVQEVYSAKTERGEAELKKTRISPQPTLEDLLREANEHFEADKPEQAIELFEEALPFCKNVNQLYSINFKLGFLYGYKMPKASKHALASCNYFRNALNVLEAIYANNDPEVSNKEKGKIFRCLSNVHFEQKNRKEAVLYGEKALLYEKRPCVKVLLHHLLGVSLRPENQRASCYHLQMGINMVLDVIAKNTDKDSDEKKELMIRANDQVSDLYGDLLKELANTYFLNFSLDEAQSNYEKALKFVRQPADKGTIWVQLGFINHKKAKIHRARNEHDRAKSFAQSAQLCFEKATQEEVKNCNKAAYNLAKSLLQRLNLATL